MSELTQCNFCGLESIKARAWSQKKKVTLIPSRYELGGLDVYVHPADINIHTCRKKKYWVCWMWAIGSKCEC